MSQSFSGHIVHIGEKQTGTKKDGGTWTSQVVVVRNENGTYPENGVFKFVGQNVSKIDRFKVGNPVTIQYNFSGYESPKGWFAGLTGWDIKNPVADDVKRDDGVNPQEVVTQQPVLNGDMGNEFNKSQSNDDWSGLPF